jgi:hypothetical protein
LGVGPRLRFGVIVDREWLSVWQRAVVDALVAGGDTELVRVLVGHESGASSSEMSTARDRASLWRLYNNGWVARRSRGVRAAGRWDAVAPDAVVQLFTVDRRGRYSQYARDDDVAAIRQAELDFVIRFGLGIIRGELLDCARYGVWSFHHDDERVIRGGPPAFWELYDGLPTSGVLLQRLTDRLDGGVPLARATFRTVLHSYPRNRDRTFLGAAALPAQVARAVRRGVLDPNALPVSASDAPIRRNPTNRQMVRFLARQAGRAVGVRARGVTRADVWTVGVVTGVVVGAGGVEVGPVEWLPELKSSGYLADPFPATRAGRTAILVEEFDEATNRGTISALERDDRGWQLHSAVLDPGVHASYPYLVEHDGELYCIPETWQARRVDIWRCDAFPTAWSRAGTLLEGSAVVDPTLVHHDGRWWLLGTLKDDEPDTKLHAWSARELLGPYEPHPLNPVKIDVTSSRPAGTPFVVDGVCYRPAQDCSTSYGGGVVLNRVVALDERGLVEETVGRIDTGAGRYESGTHTLASGGDMWVVDGRRYGVNRHRMLREARARLRVRL